MSKKSLKKRILGQGLLLALLCSVAVTMSPQSVEAQQRKTGIVLGLSKAGVQLRATRDSRIHFDLDDDHFSVRTNWVGPQTGFLVTDDPVGSFKNLSHASPDLTSALRALDTNQDGIINENDTSFVSLKLWVDANEDGKGDPGEVKSLPDAGIVGIRVPAEAWAKPVFVRADGSEGPVAEFVFESLPLDTVFTGTFQLNPETLNLPNLRGYGKMVDLYAAMSIDPVLLDMVQKLSHLTFADLHSFNNQLSMVMNRWARVEDVPSGSRGNLVDAQHLTIMEMFSGQEWKTPAGLSNPTEQAQADELERAYILSYASMKQRFLIQGLFSKLLPDIKFTFSADTVEGEGDFRVAIQSIGENAPKNPSDAARYWATFIPAVNGLAVGLGSSPNNYQITLKQVFLNSGLPNVQEAFQGNGIFFGHDETVDPNTKEISGNSFTTTDGGAHVFVGGAAINEFKGGAGSDTMIGGFGRNIMHGGAGANIFFGGMGYNDIFVEGVGDKVYCDSGVSFVHLVSQDLTGTEIDGGSGETILLAQGQNISKVKLTNVSTLDLGKTGEVRTTGAQLATFRKVLAGGDANASATIVALDPGNYDLTDKQTAGQMTIQGTSENDVLGLGAASGVLIGNGGTDIYRVGANDQDVEIRNDLADGQNAPRGELVLLNGITPWNMWFQRKGDDLVISIVGRHQNIKLTGWYDSPRAQLSKISLASGEMLNVDRISDMTSYMNFFKMNLLKKQTMLLIKRADYVGAASIAWQAIKAGYAGIAQIFTHEGCDPGFDLASIQRLPDDPALRVLLPSLWHK